ncbi:MAG: S9 family peptidase [Intrasporangium sp.]|uniref:S9 family peptidase n=1 Tax=Intrasporangium sp. TaxID=1925024 RepID=UPI002648B423|nr:S9 family peptidase [Intrasporangium sp.]MDN5795723.1 S9 family peptidase [Intrasporangium sp.]
MTSTPELSEHATIAERIIGSIVEASSPALSPDGTQVAFVVRWISYEQNARLSRVWLAPVDASARPRPVSGGEHDTAPEWSPDGRELAFVSRRGEKEGEATLHVLPVDGGETRTVTTLKEGISQVRWSPDGRWVAFLSRVRDERYAAKDVSWQPPRKVETFFTRLNDEDWTFDRPMHVHIVPADGTAPARDLMSGRHEYDGLTWLPDSSGVVTSGARHEGWDLDLATDLFVVGLDGDIRELTHQTGNYARPRVSPDGTVVSFLGQDDPMRIGNQHVGLVPLSGGEHRWVSRGLDRTFTTTAGTQEPHWVDDQTLLTTAEDRGETHLYRLRADGSSPERLTHGPVTVASFDARAGTVVACVGAVERPADLYVVEPSGALRALTDFGDRYALAVSPVGWEKFAVPCSDGSGEIDAWIMRPADLDETRRHPVILNVHGGPFTQYGETLFDEAQCQAAAGFVVLMCNPRGGSGREDRWSQSIAGPQHPVTPGAGWGSVDAEDVLAVVDTALERYAFCDPDRVGMQGGSYGGYMATHLAGTTGTRFRAICSERAVNNFLTEEFTSDVSTSFKAEMGVTHVDDPDAYVAVSPIRFVRDIEAPVLIVHSEEDYRCPVNQAEELFVAMRLLGKDVTFYRFPGENHELSRSGSPVHRRQRAEIILDFFAAHLT